MPAKKNPTPAKPSARDRLLDQLARIDEVLSDLRRSCRKIKQETPSAKTRTAKQQR